MPDMEGYWKPYEEVTNVNTDLNLGSIKIEWWDKSCELVPSLDIYGEEVRFADIPDEQKNLLMLETNIEKSRGHYYFSQKTSGKVPINGFNYIIDTKNINDYSFDGRYFYCDEQRIDFSQAIKLQNLDVNFVDKKIKITGEDLSFIDPVISYNFSTNQSYMGAYTRTSCQDNPPPENVNPPTGGGSCGSLTNVTNDTALDYSDNSYVITTLENSAGDNEGYHIFYSYPVEDLESLNEVKITSTWEGHPGDSITIYFYLWNYSSSSWYECTTHYSATGDTTKTCDINTQDISDFVNSNDEITFLAYGSNSHISIPRAINTDFFKLDITWYFPITATNGFLVYGEGTLDTPRYRTYTANTTFQSEGTAPDIGGDPEWIRVERNPIRNETMVVTRNSLRDINIFLTNSSRQFNPAYELSTKSVTVDQAYGYDIAYEQLSGDGLVCFTDDSSSANDDFIWFAEVIDGNVSSISSGWAMSSSGPEDCKLIAKSGTDDIMIMASDLPSTTPLTAALWNGTTYSNLKNLSSDVNQGSVGFYRAYGGCWLKNGSFLAFYNHDNSNNQTYRIYTGGTWDEEINLTDTGAEIEWIEADCSEKSDQALITTVDTSNDVQLFYFDGSDMQHIKELTTNGQRGRKSVGVAYEYDSDGALIVFSVYATYAVWNGSDVGSNTAFSGQTQNIVLAPYPVSDDIVVLVEENLDELVAYVWDGNTMRTGETLETDLTDTGGGLPMQSPSFDFAYDYFITPEQSKIVNEQLDNDTINFIMKVQFYNTSLSDWVNITTTYENFTGMTIAGEETIKLDQYWQPWNSSTGKGAGTYRAFIEVFDEENNTIINNEGNSFDAANFTLT